LGGAARRPADRRRPPVLRPRVRLRVLEDDRRNPALLAPRLALARRARGGAPVSTPDHRFRFLGHAERRPRPPPARRRAGAPGVRDAARLELGAGEAVSLALRRYGGRHTPARRGAARPARGPVVSPDRHGRSQPAPLTGPRPARAGGP